MGRQQMTRQLSAWTLSSVITRILQMKSRIFLTSLEMVVDLFMTWINNVADLKLKRKNFKLRWRRQKLLLKWKKTRCLEHSWNLVKSDRILTGVLLKRKMNSITPGKIMLVLWTLLEHPLRQSSVPRVRLSESRSNLKEKSMNLKLVLIMQTKPMLKD